MNLDKATLRMELAQSWGKLIEESETASRHQVLRCEGGVAALKQAADAIESHRAYYQRAVDAGELDFDGCKLCMQVIDRCIGGLHNLEEKAHVQQQVHHGKAIGVGAALAVLENQYQTEKRKVESVVSLIEQGDLDQDGRPTMRAADDLAQRKAEAKAAKAPPKKVARRRKKAAKKAGA